MRTTTPRQKVTLMEALYTTNQGYSHKNTDLFAPIEEEYPVENINVHHQ